MKASEQALEELHSTVAKILKDRLEEDEVDAKTIELCLRFLKDNGITSAEDPLGANKVDEARGRLKALRPVFDDESDSAVG